MSHELVLRRSSRSLSASSSVKTASDSATGGVNGATMMGGMVEAHKEEGNGGDDDACGFDDGA